MTAKKRTNPLKRTTTDATKAKLPKPRKRKQCPRCEKMILVDVPDIHTCYDAKALRDVEPAPDFRVVPIPCMDWPADSLPSGVHVPPDTAPYPWPVRVREWVADRVEPLRWWLALKLERLAHWVAP